ncbi:MULTISPECIES: tetratricopeptide repeat protein [Acidobacteriaceae]|uniref:tetratricopeptide repeat protein n=1 Tax=Acidobacteriaceae TaxID=204434 RepID=UPI001C209D7D|nr:MULTISPECIES: tetratricopeptide repeat protein [Acidobacteriaceae]MDW5266761.1 tetratricopeptide repeat protein [Edaphobacter sp.]
MKPNLQLTIALAVALGALATVCHAQATAATVSQRQLAFSLEQQGKNAEAETAWHAVLKGTPNNAEAYAHLGFLEALQGHYKDAAPFYRRALILDPKMPGLQMNLGLALFKGDELKEAIRVFDQLLKEQPPNSPEAQRVAILIGMARYGLGEFAMAIPYLKEATTREPQNLPFRLLLAHSCLATKQFQCVLDVYHEILTLNAESAEADMLAGEALDEMKDPDGAVRQFRAAVKANPREPNVHFGLGYLLWGQKQYENAAVEFQEELANVPNHVQALTYLADCDMHLNHPQAALPLLTQAIQIDPAVGLPHLDLGILEAAAGYREEALQQLKIAATLNPDDMNAHWQLARLYKDMGRTANAKVEFQKTSDLHKAVDASLVEQLEKASANGKVAGELNGAPSKSESVKR